MTAVRRRCACSAVIEAEPDEQSVEHAVRVHQAEPEHRDGMKFVELLRERTTSPWIRIVPTFDRTDVAQPVASLRRVG